MSRLAWDAPTSEVVPSRVFILCANSCQAGVKPVEATVAGWQPAQQPGMLLAETQTITANGQTKHHILLGVHEQRLPWKVTMRGCQESPAATVNLRRIVKRVQFAAYLSHDNRTATVSTLIPLPLQTRTAVHVSVRLRSVVSECTTEREGSRLLVMVCTPALILHLAQLDHSGSVSRPRLVAGAACRPMPWHDETPTTDGHLWGVQKVSGPAGHTGRMAGHFVNPPSYFPAYMTRASPDPATNKSRQGAVYITRDTFHPRPVLVPILSAVSAWHGAGSEIARPLGSEHICQTVPNIVRLQRVVPHQATRTGLEPQATGVPQTRRLPPRPE